MLRLCSRCHRSLPITALASAVQVAVLDGGNRQVPTGKIGEVCIQGPNVTKGYLNRPEANKEAYAGLQTGSTVTSFGSK